MALTTLGCLGLFFYPDTLSTPSPVLAHDPRGASPCRQTSSLRRVVYMLLYTCCAALLVVDFISPAHVHPWESYRASTPCYGFVGCVLLVLIAKVLRRLVMRSEDYYAGE